MRTSNETEAAPGRPAICYLRSAICNPRAFTLIELLVVIAIIAILAAVLMPALVMSNGRGHTLACEARLNDIGIALRQYVEDYHAYPAGLDALVAGRYLDDPETLNCVKTGKRFYYRKPAADAAPRSVLASCVPPETKAGHRPHEAGDTLAELLLTGKTVALRR